MSLKAWNAAHFISRGPRRAHTHIAMRAHAGPFAVGFGARSQQLRSRRDGPWPRAGQGTGKRHRHLPPRSGQGQVLGRTGLISHPRGQHAAPRVCSRGFPKPSPPKMPAGTLHSLERGRAAGAAAGRWGDAPGTARAPRAPVPAQGLCGLAGLRGSPCVTGLYPSANKQFIALKELSLLALRSAVTQTLLLAGGI